MKYEIEKNKTNIAELAKKHELDLVLLFGSQASGKIHAQSDVDIAIHGTKRFRPMELAQIQFDFSSALKIEQIEITDLKSATPLLMKEIADNSILLYERDENSYDELKLYFLRRHHDALPLLRMRTAQMNTSLQKI